MARGRVEFHRVIEPRPHARRRVFLFPHAGGSSSLFSRFRRQFPDDVEFVLGEYPGRAHRVNDSWPVDFAGLVDQACADARRYLDKPYRLFGHSMGGLLAFEMAARFHREGTPPEKVFISSLKPPSHQIHRRPIAALPEAEFVEAVESFAPIPAEVKSSPEVMGYFTRLLREDFRLLEGHRYAGGILDVPTVVLGGRSDPAVPADILGEWSGFACLAEAPRLWSGAHFYLLDHWTEVQDLLRS